MSVWQELRVWWEAPPGNVTLSLKGQIVLYLLIMAILGIGGFVLIQVF